MPDFIATLTLKQLATYIGGIVAVLATIIEFDKGIPYHPISASFKWVGDCFASSIMSRIDKRFDEMEESHRKDMEDIVNRFNEKFAEKEKLDDEKEAKRLRANILSFSDSLRVREKSSKHHFENIFRDYDDYLNYCEVHEIPNHLIDEEVEYIKSVYQKCLEDNDFL